MQEFVTKYKNYYYVQIEKYQMLLLKQRNDAKVLTLLNELRFRLEMIENTQATIEKVCVENDIQKGLDLCVELYRKMNLSVSKNDEDKNKLKQITHKVNVENTKMSAEKIHKQLNMVCVACEEADIKNGKDALEKLCCAFLYNFLVIRDSFFAQKKN